MKLHCICGHCIRKVNIDRNASTRSELANQIGYHFTITCGICKKSSNANVGIVYAESSYRYAPVPTTLGAGFIGFFFGPGGLIIGLLAGAAGGAKIRNSDKIEVNRFNNS